MTKRHRLGELADKTGAWGPPKKAPDGTALCRWCERPVKKPRLTFCSGDCVHEWKLRSNPGYVRGLVFKRDKGVCASCHLDTLTLQARWRRVVVSTPDLQRWFWREGQGWLNTPPPEAVPILEEAARLGFSLRRVRSVVDGKSPWEADHAKALIEKGGHDLDNVRTLCVGCHDRETVALSKRRRSKK